MVTTNHPTDVTGLLGGATGTWALDPSATTIELHTKAMWGLVKVKANFNALSGSATVTAGAVNGALVIDAASVNSGNKKRDAHLRTADFFDVGRHPTFTYAVTAASPAEQDQLKLTGTLTIAEIPRPLEILATVTEATATSATLVTEVDIDRRDWGVSWAKMGAKLDNHLLIRARFTKSE